MDNEAPHDLTAAYALDALDPAEERAYEAHLAQCELCRAELAELRETVASLAYGVDTPEPPARLRSRILAQAGAEQTNVVPMPRRWTAPAAVAFAAAAAAVAIGLGIWASSLSDRLDHAEVTQQQSERVADILATEGTVSTNLDGRGKLIVTPSGEGALVLNRLEPPAPGHVYEAWVSEGGKPRPAGLFKPGRKVTAFPLTIPVPTGAAVMVTEEKAGGTDLPTSVPLFLVRT